MIVTTKKSVHRNIWTEIRARWRSKSPYLFRVIQRISVFLSTVAGIPAGLKMAGVNLPPYLDILASKTVTIAAVVAFLVSKLPVDTHEATKEVLKEIDNKKPE